MSLKVAFLTHYDARDINRWSGTAYFMSVGLKEVGCDVEYIGPLAERGQFIIRARVFLYRHFSRKNYYALGDPIRLKGFGKEASEKLRKSSADVVLCPNMFSLPYLETDKPVVLWADCTFASMVDFYPDYTNLSAQSLRVGHKMEEMALKGCRLTIFASEWAARSAMEDYGIAAEKVKVVPYGANIICNRTEADIEKFLQGRSADKCRLLFIGKVWERKGGALALAVAEELNRRGLPTVISLVGSLPDSVSKYPPYVEPIGFIDKSKEEGKRQIEKLYEEAHFLIVPSRAEAFGIVFCEASSYGVPSIATNVGGIPSVIRDNFNGRTFPLSATASEYADYIIEVMSDYNKYRQLALSSFNEYRTRLNWGSAIKRVKELLEGIVQKK